MLFCIEFIQHGTGNTYESLWGISMIEVFDFPWKPVIFWSLFRLKQLKTMNSANFVDLYPDNQEKDVIEGLMMLNNVT